MFTSRGKRRPGAYGANGEWIVPSLFAFVPPLLKLQQFVISDTTYYLKIACGIPYPKYGIDRSVLKIVSTVDVFTLRSE